MIAYQTALDFYPWLRYEHEFGVTSSSLRESTLQRRTPAGFKVERLLKQLGWTVSAVSLQSKMRFGEDSPYFVPRTFLYKQKSGITPHISQIVALSQITDHPFHDWMKICGFDLALILQLQLRVANERTTMLMPECDFETIPKHMLGSGGINRYCYAKIGSRDAVLYPELRPGTIVRADRFYSPATLNTDASADKMWLVEHPTGITCCRIKSVGKEEVVLLPNCPPLSGWPLRVPTQARILGLIDGHLHPFELREFRPLTRVPDVTISFSSSNTNGKFTFSGLLRKSRRRMGLTFRDAHKNTLRIAEVMNDCTFAISTGLLSDYEAINKLPRHIAKIMSLCVTYGIELYELLHAAGVRPQTPPRPGLFTSETLVRKEGHGVTSSVNTVESNWRRLDQPA